MKSVSLILFVIVLTLAGCGEQTSTKSTSSDFLAYGGITSQGTSFVDTSKSAFDINSVNMISTPNSSCFSQIGYDKEHSILVVTFKDSGITYLYLDFSSSDWNAFKSADSLGTYYNQNIKEYYECNRWN